jgi:hypothetical protein
MEYNRYFIYRHPLEVLEPHFERTLQNINRLAAMVNDAGARFVLVVVPRFHHWNPKESPDYWEKDQYTLDEPHQHAYLEFFDRKQDELPYPVFNLLPAFQATETFPLVIPGDTHWNTAGNRLVAETLSEYLVNEGHVP